MKLLSLENPPCPVIASWMNQRDLFYYIHHLIDTYLNGEANIFELKLFDGLQKSELVMSAKQITNTSQVYIFYFSQMIPSNIIYSQEFLFYNPQLHELYFFEPDSLVYGPFEIQPLYESVLKYVQTFLRSENLLVHKSYLPHEIYNNSSGISDTNFSGFEDQLQPKESSFTCSPWNMLVLETQLMNMNESLPSVVSALKKDIGTEYTQYLEKYIYHLSKTITSMNYHNVFIHSAGYSGYKDFISNGKPISYNLRNQSFMKKLILKYVNINHNLEIVTRTIKELCCLQLIYRSEYLMLLIVILAFRFNYQTGFIDKNKFIMINPQKYRNIHWINGVLHKTYSREPIHTHMHHCGPEIVDGRITPPKHGMDTYEECECHYRRATGIAFAENRRSIIKKMESLSIVPYQKIHTLFTKYEHGYHKKILQELIDELFNL